MLAVLARFDTRAFRCFDNGNGVLFVIGACCALHSIRELGSNGTGHLKPGFMLANADRTDFIARDVPAATDQR